MASQEFLDAEALWLASASLDNVVRDHDTELKSIVSINNVFIVKLPVKTRVKTKRLQPNTKNHPILKRSSFLAYYKTVVQTYLH